MRAWSRIPRGVRDRVAGVLPAAWWEWLHDLREVEVDRAWLGVAVLRQAYPELAAPQPAGRRLHPFELRVHSQNGEDGIVAHLLHRIGVANRQVVEFGIGDGRECCSAALLRHFGWGGLLLDGSAANVERARALHGETPAFADGRLVILQRLVEPDNVDELVAAHVDADVDVASIDIDGNDYWVWRALTSVRPRLVVIEFNSTFGPERSVTVPYTPGFDRYRAHVSGFYHGASLTALARLGTEKGYRLVGCDSRGTNAFFVRDDVAPPDLVAVSPREAFTTLVERRHLPLERQLAQIAHLPLEDV